MWCSCECINSLGFPYFRPNLVSVSIINLKERRYSLPLLCFRVLSFVGEYPETAVELHKQLQEQIEASTTLDDVRGHLSELANDNFILTAEKSDGMALYWR